MPLSWIYSKVIEHRNRKFDDGVTEAAPLGARTISIGNITTGGTGKTPLVIKTASLLAARGKRVCVLTRGYGRKDEKTRVVVSDGRRIESDPSLTGDEPLEMARALKGKALVIADADRTAAAKWAKPEFGVNAFILDDGFQHRQVKRDLDIVCIDALDPFGGEKLLPSGRLREPLDSLSRANVIVITRSDAGGDLNAIREKLKAHAPLAKVFTAVSRMSRMTPLDKFLSDLTSSSEELSAAAVDYSALANSKGFAFCGLGNPEAFFKMLGRDNFDLAGTLGLADHAKYDRKILAKLEKDAAAAGASFLITTGKDAVKLGGVRPKMPCFVIEIETRLDDEEGFLLLL